MENKFKLNNYRFNDENYNNIKIMLSDDLKNRIIHLKKKFKYKEVIIVCIGTDKIIGDSYGPLVGSNLIDRKLPSNVNIYGVMKNTLNATNICEFVSEYYYEMSKKLVIAIDAAVSYSDHFKSINIFNGSIRPGSARGIILPKIGDISLQGIISNSCTSFKNIDKKDIIQMSNITADAATRALWQEQNTDDIKKYTFFKH